MSLLTRGESMGSISGECCKTLNSSCSAVRNRVAVFSEASTAM